LVSFRRYAYLFMGGVHVWVSLVRTPRCVCRSARVKTGPVTHSNAIVADAISSALSTDSSISAGLYCVTRRDRIRMRD
jgi:hypothetical protein